MKLVIHEDELFEERGICIARFPELSIIKSPNKKTMLYVDGIPRKLSKAPLRQITSILKRKK